MSQHFTSQSLFPFNHHVHQCDVQQYHPAHPRRTSTHSQPQQQEQQQQPPQPPQPQQPQQPQQQPQPSQHQHQHQQHSQHHQHQLSHIAPTSTGRTQFLDSNQHLVAHFTNHYSQFAVEPLSVSDATNQFMSAIQQQNPQLQDSATAFNPVSFFVQQQNTTTTATTSTTGPHVQLAVRQHGLSYQHAGSISSQNHATSLGQHHDQHNRAAMQQQLQPRQMQHLQPAEQLSGPLLISPAIGCDTRGSSINSSNINKSATETLCTADDSNTTEQQPLSSYRGSNKSSRSNNNSSSNRKFKAESRLKNCDSPRRTFECPVCSKGFTEKFNMKRHMQIHSQSRPKYICNECSKSFAWKDNFIRHKKAAHETNVPQFSL